EMCILYTLFFFFSSRRRHTRSKRDWSSDVCSSDLVYPAGGLSASLAALTHTPCFKNSLGQGFGWCCLFTAYTVLFSQFRLNFSFITYLTSYHWTFSRCPGIKRAGNLFQDFLLGGAAGGWLVFSFESSDQGGPIN